MVVSALYVSHWTSPIHDMKRRFIAAYSKGMETSDLISAFWSAYFYHEAAFCSGTNLALLAKDADLYAKQMNDYVMLNHLTNLKSIQKLVSELQGVSPYVSGLDEGEGSRALRSNFSHQVKDRLLGAVFFGDWEQGAELGIKYSDLIGKSLLGQYSSVVSPFVTSLCCFEMARQHTSHSYGNKYYNAALANFQLIKDWSQKGNPNTQHYLLLLRAEKAECKGKLEQALSFYKEAILRAGRGGYIHDQALANERLAAHYTRTGDVISAKYSLEDAMKLYEEWGAAKKVKLLEEQLAKM